MTAPRLARVLALPLALAATVGAIACSGPSGNELFAKNGITSGAAANLGGSSGAAAGTDSAPNQAQTQGGGSDTLGGTATGGSTGAVSGYGGSAGSEPSLGGSGGSGGQVIEVPVIESCDMLEGAVINEQNGHCYRVTNEDLTFAAARDACHAAGGHLLTVTSDEENDFARDLHDGEHWLGADDGLADTAAGVGTYAWVNEEPWDYTDWQDGQPNAFETNCPGGGDSSDCFEHCAYQTDEGDWIDRSCWHTIVSICEWEPVDPTVL